MVRVKLSKQRLEGLGYFERWRPGRKPPTCPIARTSSWTWRKRTPAICPWARGSAPWIRWSASRNTTRATSRHRWFRGGGQKLRLRATVGTERQDYELTFIEPWFLESQAAVEASICFIVTMPSSARMTSITRARGGARFSLERALGSDFLRGGVSYYAARMWVLPCPTAPTSPRATCRTIFWIRVGHHILSTWGPHWLTTPATASGCPTKASAPR